MDEKSGQACLKITYEHQPEEFLEAICDFEEIQNVWFPDFQK